MRIFVGEYVCGGGLSAEEFNDIPASLRQEGAAMLNAIVTRSPFIIVFPYVLKS